MCGPAIGLVGAAVSAVGAIAAGNAQASQAEYNARVEKINARSRRQEGYKEQEDIGQKYERVMGEQRAGYGAAGVDPSFGSALAVFGETQEDRIGDQGRAYTNAEAAATSHENKAKQYEFEAKQARQAGAINAASSFLGGLGGAVKGMGSAGAGVPLMIG